MLPSNEHACLITQRHKEPEQRIICYISLEKGKLHSLNCIMVCAGNAEYLFVFVFFTSTRCSQLFVLAVKWKKAWKGNDVGKKNQRLTAENFHKKSLFGNLSKSDVSEESVECSHRFYVFGAQTDFCPAGTDQPCPEPKTWKLYFVKLISLYHEWV